MKAILNKREIARKKKLASQYKGISYRADDDVFVVRVRVGTDLNGKAIYFLPVRRYTDFKDALRRLDEVKTLVKRGAVEQKRLTFREIHEILKDILKNQTGSQIEVKRGLARNTLTQTSSAFNRIMMVAPNIYDKGIDEVSKEELSEFLKKWSETPAIKGKNKPPTPAQVNKQYKNIYNVIIKQTYEEIKEKIQERNIDVNKLKSIFDVKLRAENVRTVGEAKAELVYTFEELKRLWKEVSIIDDEDRKNAKHAVKLCYKLQILTGARISELAGLLKMDIMKKPTYEGGYCINIYKQKGDKKTGTQPLKTEDSKRIVPITEDMYMDLLSYAKENNIGEKDFIFSRWIKSKKKLEDYSAGTIKNSIQMIENAAGIEHTENRATHGFRHTLTTYFGISGVGLSLDVIDKFIGHKENDNSTSKKFYVMKKPTAIDFKNFIAAQLAYADCLSFNSPEEDLPKLFKVYIEVLDNKLSIERGNLNAYDNLEDAKKFNTETIVYKGHKIEISKEVCLHNYQGEERDKVRKSLIKLYYANNFVLDEEFSKEYDCLPRKERLTLSKEEFIHKSKEETEKMLTFGTIITESEIRELANSEGYKKYYYNNVMPEAYRENNSFDDFIMDIKEGIISTEFNIPFIQRTDRKNILNYAKSIGMFKFSNVLEEVKELTKEEREEMEEKAIEEFKQKSTQKSTQK